MKTLSEDDEKKLEKNLTWIFADRRSGTTWLAAELLSYKTKKIDEPLIGQHIGRYTQSEQIINRTIDIQKDREDYFFSKKYNDVWKYFLRKLILNRIYVQFQTTSEKIIIKEPSGSLAADILLQCFPNSKFIFLLRDGRDIVDSKIDALSLGGWELKLYKEIRKEVPSKRRIIFIRRTANYWVGLMEILMRAYDKHAKNLRFKIRYEDLRHNTLSELKKLYQFLEIDIDDNALGKIVNKYSFDNLPESEKGEGKFRRSASPGDWKKNFNEEEKQILNEIMGNTLKKMDY